MIEYRLQFFAKEGPGGEKTEKPTAKKLEDAAKTACAALHLSNPSSVRYLTVFSAGMSHRIRAASAGGSLRGVFPPCRHTDNWVKEQYR